MPPPPAPTTTYPASARVAMVPASTTSSGSGDATTRRQPFSPRSSQVCPCSISGAGLVLGQVAADRLGRLAEARVVAVDEGAGDHGRRTPVDAAVGQRLVQRVEDQEADRALGLRTAPVQRHRRHDVRGELVLHQQVADLRAVAVGEDDVGAGRDEVGHPLHRDADGPVLVLGVALPSGPVMALPPRAMSTRMRWTLVGPRALRTAAGHRSAGEVDHVRVINGRSIAVNWCAVAAPNGAVGMPRPCQIAVRRRAARSKARTNRAATMRVADRRDRTRPTGLPRVLDHG